MFHPGVRQWRNTYACNYDAPVAGKLALREASAWQRIFEMYLKQTHLNCTCMNTGHQVHKQDWTLMMKRNLEQGWNLSYLFMLSGTSTRWFNLGMQNQLSKLHKSWVWGMHTLEKECTHYYRQEFTYYSHSVLYLDTCTFNLHKH